MIVYELTIRVASAYEDIEDILTNDEIAKAIHRQIVKLIPDACEPLDFAIQMTDHVKTIFDSDKSESPTSQG